MRKTRKREMLNLLKIMGNVSDLLLNLEDPSIQIQDFFAACECLKQNLEEETAPLSLDILQSIENSLKENKFDFREDVKKLTAAFDSEITPKREALFLPYKVSMWDSLESIYLAAKDDPSCNALVMPIPYYDKINGKFEEMHWETNYPNIPVIDYRKYDFNERQPDIVFIHNPYDDLNTVTSVHPDFYSEKLRNLTDCLVYVPYFVGNGKNVAKALCTMPGCIFSHKVIVQTEEERKIYVREYNKVTGENGDKFIALGSPKLDKAINAKREDYKIPTEWENLINNKKVVFYNTSIGALLKITIEKGKTSNKYLQKIKSVFEFFRKQSDVVLLWRPHPLLESTIKSMLPWMEQEYAEIVNEYKNGKYGIYDDSEDLNRAVALSDVYYGDNSSVMILFEAAGKPVAWQFSQYHYAPIVRGFWADEIYLWFIDGTNALCKRNKQNNKTEFAGIISQQNPWTNTGIAENKKKLYFAPLLGDKISVFDLEKNIFEQIDFRNDCDVDGKFHGVIIFKNFVYFIPREFPAIMRLNTDTNEITYFSEWLSELSKLQVSKLQEFEHTLFFGFCIVDKEIALVINGTNAVMFFNMETGGYEIKRVWEESGRYVSICFNGQDYYLSSLYENYIVKWNRISNKTSKIKLPSSFSRKSTSTGNFSIQYLNGYIWLIPYAANGAYKINILTDKVTELPEFMKYVYDKNSAWHYSLPFADGNIIYASTINKGIAKYNTDTGQLNFISDFGNEAALALWLRDCKFNEPETKIGNAGKTIWEYFK